MEIDRYKEVFVEELSMFIDVYWRGVVEGGKFVDYAVATSNRSHEALERVAGWSDKKIKQFLDETAVYIGDEVLKEFHE